VGGVNYGGEWIHVEFPFAIYIQAFRFWVRNRSAVGNVLSTVNNGVVVGYIGSVGTIIWSGSIDSWEVWVVRNVAPGSYTQLRFICLIIYPAPGSTRFRVEELAYIGSTDSIVMVAPQSVQAVVELQI
jgi:hypothetical protein